VDLRRDPSDAAAQLARAGAVLPRYRWSDLRDALPVRVRLTDVLRSHRQQQRYISAPFLFLGLVQQTLRLPQVLRRFLLVVLSCVSECHSSSSLANEADALLKILCGVV
jgi:hypothetical protein